MASNPVCPACLSIYSTEKFQVSSAQAAQTFVQAKEHRDINLRLKSHIERLWMTAHCEIRLCSGCGFGFAWPFAAGDDVFYNLAYPNVGYPKMKWEFQRTLHSCSDLSSKSVLEVGAGYGFFLDLLCKNGASATNIEAIEYNADSMGQLRSRGYTTTPHDMRSAAFGDRASSFDYIFLFQVVEHMANLDALFSRLRTIAKPHGSIFISVPNNGHIDYQESHGSLIDMPPNHIGRWTVRAFEAIASRNGLELAEAEIEPFNAPLFLGRDLHFSHIRRSQERPNSLSALTRSLPRGRLRKLAELVAIIAGAPSRIPHWLSAFGERQRLGQSLWVHLKPITK